MNTLNIEQLTPKQLEQICKDSGYMKVFIMWADFLGYTKDNHAIYKCGFSDTYETTIGNLYIREKEGMVGADF